ncbi:glutaredoxin family protein [Undibacterium jejuense]|uniref:Glutaredoxin family protein n=1 Tax=Undibacterium jejuense TaxID=1344949 RepID=A0A923KQ06_9BURK|nr:glutaredoxin family protein [Undibacterium jejuense]MBC3862619.1 glutaredoxin family protein [Undibacterium jejuense]
MQAPFKLATLIVPLCLLAATAQAQLYKSVGPDGKVTYSDTPPPANQKLVETKTIATSQDVTNFPYELKLAASKNPVTIYTAANCSPCNDGKNLLKSAGVPFAEKTVKTSADADKLKQVSGDDQLPFLTVGSKKLHGYDQAEWKSSITAAGYPDSNRLPANYVYPAPESAAPKNKPDPSATAPKNLPPPAPAPIKSPENDNGFRF